MIIIIIINIFASHSPTTLCSLWGGEIKDPANEIVYSLSLLEFKKRKEFQANIL